MAPQARITANRGIGDAQLHNRVQWANRPLYTAALAPMPHPHTGR